jgi:hypothetical protein
MYIMLCFSFVFRCFVYHMLAVSLDCTFLIAPSVFSNVYLMYALYFRFDSLVCRIQGGAAATSINIITLCVGLIAAIIYSNM